MIRHKLGIFAVTLGSFGLTWAAWAVGGADAPLDQPGPVTEPADAASPPPVAADGPMKRRYVEARDAWLAAHSLSEGDDAEAYRAALEHADRLSAALFRDAPDEAGVATLRGEVLWAGGKEAEAAAVFEQQPDYLNPRNMLRLIQYYRKSGDDEGIVRIAPRLMFVLSFVGSRPENQELVTAIYEHLAHSLIELKRVRQAALTLDALEKIDPDTLYLHQARATLYTEHLRQPEKAAEAARRLIELAPQNPHALHTAAATHLKLGDEFAALGFWERLLELDASPRNALMVSALWLGQGHHEAAVASAAQTRELAQAQGDQAADAIAALIEVVFTEPDGPVGPDGRRVKQAMALAKMLHRMHMHASVDAAVQAAIKAEDPQTQDARRLAGDWYFQLNRADEAITIYESIYAETRDAKVGLRLAEAYLRAGRPEEALKQIEAAGAALGPRADTAALRVSALVQLGRWADAVAYADEQIERYPDASLLRRVRAEALASSRDQLDLRRALDDYAARLEVVPTDTEARDKAILLAFKINELDRVIAFGEPWLAGGGGHPLAMTGLGTALYQRQRYEEAARAYQAVLDAAPESPSVLNNYAYLLATELDQPAEALPLIERAVQLTRRGNADVLDTLGVVQLKLGRSAYAIRTLRVALEIERKPIILLHLAEAQSAFNEPEAALATAKQAIALAQETGDDQVAQEAEQFAASIEASTPDPESAPRQTQSAP